MNPDFIDLLRAFGDADVRFMVVGAYALGAHGRPRATGDLDIWVDATPVNAGRVMRALTAFGAPVTAMSEADFAREGVTYQIGIPPGRIDILTELTGLAFEHAWPRRVRHLFGEIEVDVIGREDFILNKKATGRLKDLADAEALEP
ncbi:MAG: hypothetical protein ACRD2N_11770 [Vicinamibacterales bacterium]